MKLRERIDVVLVEPAEGGNVGAVARVLANLGLSSLWLVAPRVEDWGEARKLAVHAGWLLDKAQRVETLQQAVARAHWVVGTSCRPRRHPERKPPLGPEEFVERLRSTGARERVALVFGPEACGLSNQQLALCQDILCLPTSKHYPSLNLSHAVALVAWLAVADRRGEKRSRARAPATAADLEGLVEHMRRTLSVIGFLDPQNPEMVLADLRRLFWRGRPDPRQVQMLRGIFHCMDVWCARHGGPPTPNQIRRSLSFPRQRKNDGGSRLPSDAEKENRSGQRN